MRNVSIVGAGTSGLIAAKRLGELGVRARVYEQKAVLGLPVRASGIVSITGLATLGVDYSASITNTLHGANIHAAGKTMRVRAEKAVAHVLDRKKLNDICHDNAVGSGADVITGNRIAGAALERMSEEGVVIGADGAVSSVAAHFSMGRTPRHVLTWKAEYNIRAPEEGVVDLFFDNNCCKGLFAWLCPNSKDILEVGVGIDPRYGNSRAAFSRFIAKKEIRDIIGSGKPLSEGAAMIPMALRKKVADESKRVLLVGDAAGHVKPTTGGGIVFGGNGAMMAADVVSSYLDGKGDLQEYGYMFAKRYGMDIAMHSLINKVYSYAPHPVLGASISMMNALGMDRFLGRYGDMDRPTVMLKRFFLRSLAL
jgi:flavin-dependent dehydrogenase